MSNKGNALVLSIRREHATRIFEGSKQFELRKTLPHCDLRRVYLYESGGGGMIGCFDPKRIIRAPKDALWAEVNYRATTSRRFDQYFENRSAGCAIEVAHPLKFDTPISLQELRTIKSSFRVPMSSDVISLETPLGLHLEKKRAQTRRRLGPQLILVPILTRDRAVYERWVLKHIGRRYDGIDGTFAAHNLDVHDLGHDPVGFFTERKEVLSIMRGKNRIGFTTITWKSNGCAKTGPTILGTSYRGKGLGRAARREIESHVRAAGYRKIYCTCADDAKDIIGYLLDSGMKIEAHLDRQYSAEHGELIFGKFLAADEYVDRHAPTRQSIRGQLLDIHTVPKNRLRDAVEVLFGRDWIAPDEAFADKILQAAFSKGKPDARKKAKRIVCVGKGEEVYGLVILLPKRGGAVKALMCSATDDLQTLKILIEECVHLSCGWGSRKVYFLHPLLDAAIVKTLKESQFQMEGFLKAPYRPGEDVGVFSRFC